MRLLSIAFSMSTACTAGTEVGPAWPYHDGPDYIAPNGIDAAVDASSPSMVAPGMHLGGRDGLDPLEGQEGDEGRGADDSGPLDSDGDGYPDAWELAEGTDPYDSDDRIYVGGWPYFPDKDALAAGDGSPAMIGKPSPRFVAEDQFNDDVELFDFAGTPTLLFVTSTECASCDGLLGWLEGRQEGQWENSSAFVQLRQRITAGDLDLVVLVDPREDTIDVSQWAFEHEVQSAALYDDNSEYSVGVLGVWGWPTMALMDGQMGFVTLDTPTTLGAGR